MLGIDPLLAAAKAGLGAALLERVDDVLHASSRGVLGQRIGTAGGKRQCGAGG
jgi:hypothetical protein